MRPVLPPPTRPETRRRRPRLTAVQVLPTLLTLGNVLAGFVAISYAVDAASKPIESAAREALWMKAAWAIFVGMVCDVLDGRVARLTGMASSFGAELDSLADMITFGVAPAVLAKAVAQQELAEHLHPKVATILATVYVLGAALRLARYNVESARVTEPGHVTRVFRGLPSPGAAGVIASLVLLRRAYDIDSIAWVTTAALPVLGLLMVSRFAYSHVMNRYLQGSRSPLAILLLILAVYLIVEHLEASLAAVFAAFALSGPLLALARATIGRPRWADDEDDDEEVVPPAENAGDAQS